AADRPRVADRATAVRRHGDPGPPDAGRPRIDGGRHPRNGEPLSRPAARTWRARAAGSGALRGPAAAATGARLTGLGGVALQQGQRAGAAVPSSPSDRPAAARARRRRGRTPRLFRTATALGRAALMLELAEVSQHRACREGSDVPRVVDVDAFVVLIDRAVT